MTTTTKMSPNISSEGHRQRVRDKFLKSGGRGMADYELLEAYLMIAIPRRDVKPIAKALIARFGDFAEVINAAIPDLMEVDGIGEGAVFALKMIKEAAVRMSWEVLKEGDAPVIADMDNLVDYCRMSMSYQDVEEFKLIYLNAKNMVIDEETQQRGTINHVSIHPREVVRSALEKNACAVIMVHNHPTGDTTPSKADIEVTRKVKEALKSMNIELHDHLIVSKFGYYSFRDAGLV